MAESVLTQYREIGTLDVTATDGVDGDNRWCLFKAYKDPWCYVCSSSTYERCPICGIPRCSACSQEPEPFGFPHERMCNQLRLGEPKRPSPDSTRVIRLDNALDGPAWDYLPTMAWETSGSMIYPLCDRAYKYTYEMGNKHVAVLSNWWSSSHRCSLVLITAAPWGSPTGVGAYNGRFGQINRAIRDLAPAGQLYPWSATAFLAAWRHEPDSSSAMVPRFVDVTMEHYHQAVILLLSYVRNPCVRADIRGRGIVQALKINSWAETEFAYKDKVFLGMERVLAPAGLDPIIKDTCQWPSPLAWMVGLPWVCRLAPATFELLKSENSERFWLEDRRLLKNDQAILVAALYTDPDGADNLLPQTRSLRGIRYVKDPGTVLVINTTGACVEPEHLVAFNTFAGARLRHIETDPTFQGNPMDFFTKQEFLSHWESFKTIHGL